METSATITMITFDELQKLKKENPLAAKAALDEWHQHLEKCRKEEKALVRKYYRNSQEMYRYWRKRREKLVQK